MLSRGGPKLDAWYHESNKLELQENQRQEDTEYLNIIINQWQNSNVNSQMMEFAKDHLVVVGPEPGKEQHILDPYYGQEKPLEFEDLLNSMTMEDANAESQR